MSGTRTADEVKAGYIAAMGDELGALFYVLTTELTWACWRWQQFLDLFGDKPSRVALANRAAPFFFWIVQRSLWDDVLLTISWMTGPPGSKRRSNLSLQRLPPLIRDATLRKGVDAELTTIIQVAEFAKVWRNRTIAHKDLKLA